MKHLAAMHGIAGGGGPMAVPVLVPKLGPNMAGGIIAEWYLPDGASVGRGEPVFRLECDYVAVEVEAETAGVLRHQLDDDGIGRPGSVAAIILAPGERMPATQIDDLDDPEALFAARPQPPAPGEDIIDWTQRASARGAAGAGRDTRPIPLRRRSEAIYGPLRGGTTFEQAAVSGFADAALASFTEPTVESSAEAPASLPDAQLPEPASAAASSSPGPPEEQSAETRPEPETDDVRGAELAAEATSGVEQPPDAEPPAAQSAPPAEPAAAEPEPVIAAPASETETPFYDDPGEMERVDLAPDVEEPESPQPFDATSAPLTADAPAPSAVPARMSVLFVRTMANVSEVGKMRAQLAREWRSAGLQPADEDVVVRAVARALRESPAFSELDDSIGVCSLEEERTVLRVVHNAATRQFRDAVAAIAREDTVSGDDDQPCSCTVTSLAEFALDEGTPHLRPGQSIALTMGAVRPTAIFNGNRFDQAPFVTLTLAYDAALPEGVAVRLLARIRDLVEAPYALLVA